MQVQIERLERELATVLADSWPRTGIDVAVGAPTCGPRLLDLGELEELRDAMVARVASARAALRARQAVEQLNRDRLEDMLRDPRAHRWERIRSADLGEHGCRNWHVVPRFGILGMLLDWWRVRISSGCP